MKIRIFSLMMVGVLLIFSCKNTKKTTQGDYSDLIVNTPVAEDISVTGVTIRTESVKQVDQPENAPMYGYYVIIGSYRNIAGARQQSAEMVVKGFTPVILESENGLFRISVGGYNEENAARARIAGIRAAYEEHRDVWLLIRR